MPSDASRICSIKEPRKPVAASSAPRKLLAHSSTASPRASATFTLLRCSYASTGCETCFVLLPGGRPRRRGSTDPCGNSDCSSSDSPAAAAASFSHEGGRPRRRPLPRARRSSVRMASSICSRSSRSSASILSTSKFTPPVLRFSRFCALTRSTCYATVTLHFIRSLRSV